MMTADEHDERLVRPERPTRCPRCELRKLCDRIRNAVGFPFFGGSDG